MLPQGCLERHRERDTERHRETQRDTERHRETERERERQRERETLLGSLSLSRRGGNVYVTASLGEGDTSMWQPL